MNRGERIAEENLCNACKYYIEGYYENLKEGKSLLIPDTKENLERFIYTSALKNLYFSSGDGCQLGVPPKEMGLVEESFCIKVIRNYLGSDDKFKEVAKHKNWGKYERGYCYE